MPLVTDWLMVIITLIYVIATIYICVFNGRSAEATRKQVEESQRQFEEKKRIEMLPFLQLEKANSSHEHEYEMNLVLNSDDLGNSHIAKLKLKNIGNGTAKDISYNYEWDNFNKKCDKGAFPVMALQAGDEKHIRINFAMPQQKQEEIKSAFVLFFYDLLENKYSQRIEFYWTNEHAISRKSFKFKTFSPILMKED